jgi:hypothetical protein
MSTAATGERWAHPALGRQHMVNSLVTWAQQWPWTIFATLTLKEHRSHLSAQRLVVRWLRFAARKLYRAHVRYMLAHDTQERGVIHFHVLLVTPRLDASDLAALDTAWRRTSAAAGHARIDRVDGSAGALRYMVATHAAWDTNVACNRRRSCRRKGCTEAPGPQ